VLPDAAERSRSGRLLPRRALAGAAPSRKPPVRSPRRRRTLTAVAWRCGLIGSSAVRDGCCFDGAGLPVTPELRRGICSIGLMRLPEGGAWKLGRGIGAGVATGVLLVCVMAAAGPASAATNRLIFSGALNGTVPSHNVTSCDAGSGGMNWPLDATLSPSTARNWSLSLVFPGNGTYKTFAFGGKASFVLQSGLNGWVATSGSFTIRGKNSGERGGSVQLDETVTVNLTLGAHEGGATGKVYVKGSWKCG
jgi:hypothetical protein